MARRMILPKGNDGDITYGWDEADDPTVLPIIQQMLAEKWLFFVLKADGTQQELVSVDQAITRSIVIPSPLLEQLHQAGILKIAKVGEDVIPTGQIART